MDKTAEGKGKDKYKWTRKFHQEENILPELNGIVDSMSISLDAQDEETYNSICRPAFQNA